MGTVEILPTLTAIMSVGLLLGNLIAKVLRLEKEREASTRRMQASVNALAKAIKLHGAPVLPDGPMSFELPEMAWPALPVATGYRTSLVRSPRLDAAPRTGLRSVGYLGNQLALRARPASAWRILGAWLRGAMVRLWKRSRTDWCDTCAPVAPMRHRRERKLGIGTYSGGPS